MLRPFLLNTRLLSTRSSAKVSSNARLFTLFSVATGGAVYLLWPRNSKQDPLSPFQFTPAKLVSEKQCTADSKLLTLSIPKHLVPPPDTPGLKPVWSVFIKDDDIQVERPYTPLEGIDDDGNMLFWIKKYPKGEVGRWLHSKSTGDTVELRGPLMSWNWQENVWDEVVLISGGTGITPFYQLFHSIIRHPDISPSTRFSLIHASKSREDLPPTEIIAPLLEFSEKCPNRLSVSLHVDTLDDDTQGPKLQAGFIDKSAILRAVNVNKSKTPSSWWDLLWKSKSLPPPDTRKILFLVCGPEPMIGAIAGPFGRNLSQGPVGGILAELGYNSDQVRKL